MPSYSPTGPFINGASPGISASYCNGLENWILQAEGSAGSIVVNGSTSGTATIYQTLQGLFKLTLIVFNNYKNAGAAINQALPGGYAFGAIMFSSQINGVFFNNNGGSNITLSILTGLPATGNPGAGGGITSNGFIGPYSTAYAINAFNTLQFGAGNTQTVNGYLIILGS